MPTGLIGDKYGRKKFNYWCMFNGTIHNSKLFFYSIALFIISSFILGIRVTFTSGSGEAIIVDSLIINDEKDKISRYGVYMQTIFYTALAISALVGGWIANQFSYNEVYLIQIIILAIQIIVLIFIKEPIVEHTEDFRNLNLNNIVAFAVENRIIMYVLLIHILIAVAFISLDYYYGSYLVMLGYTPTTVGIIIFNQ